MQRTALAATLLALAFWALPAAARPPVPERPPEAADDSLSLDARAIAGIAAEAARLEQAARDVMAAPGARFTAPYRLAAARALTGAAGLLSEKAARLRAADADLEDALLRRALARAEVAAAIAGVAGDARSGILTELERTPSPSSELLAAKASAFTALANAEGWALALMEPDRIEVGVVFAAPVPEPVRAQAGDIFAALFADLGEGAVTELAGDTLRVTAAWPQGQRMAQVRAGIEARLAEAFAAGSQGEPLGLPATRLITIDRVPAGLAAD